MFVRVCVFVPANVSVRVCASERECGAGGRGARGWRSSVPWLSSADSVARVSLFAPSVSAFAAAPFVSRVAE